MAYDFARILAEVESSPALLSLTRIAEIFGTWKTTVEGWRKEAYGFPANFDLNKDARRTRKRYWRPDHVAAWIRERMRIEECGINLDEVSALVGMHRDTWAEWVKVGDAPAHRYLALGTGHHLWDRAEVLAWLKERTGGYTIPSDVKTPPSTNAKKAKARGPTRRKLEAKPESHA